jgi:hypothetical protein
MFLANFTTRDVWSKIFALEIILGIFLIHFRVQKTFIHDALIFLSCAHPRDYLNIYTTRTYFLKTYSTVGFLLLLFFPSRSRSRFVYYNFFFLGHFVTFQMKTKLSPRLSPPPCELWCPHFSSLTSLIKLFFICKSAKKKAKKF